MSRMLQTDLIEVKKHAIDFQDGADRNRITVLQLSDLHFGRKNVDNKPDGPTGKPYNQYLSNLAAELEKVKEQEGPFDLIAVTGDLVDYDVDHTGAHAAALGEARKFLNGLCKSLKVPNPEGLLVIPGNHDYLFKGIFPRPKAPGSFQTHFHDLFHHRWYPKLNLLVACFDSNVDKSSLRFATGVVNKEQITELNGELKKEGWKDAAESAFRMALVHHHLLPIGGDSENLRPTGWLERRFGRKLIGTPELMLLRNSGQFLRHLFKEGYQLVLHGHLHEPSSTTCQTFQERHRILEVVACGATGLPVLGTPCAFNVVRLHRNGAVIVKAYEMRHDGTVEGRSLPTGSYEVVRAAMYDHRPSAGPATESTRHVRCDRVTHFVDVLWPSGDVLVEEVIEGLRCEPGHAQEELAWDATVKGYASLSGASFTAADPASDGRVHGKVTVVEVEPGKLRLHYQLRFPHKLDDKRPLRVVCRRRLFGALLSSREAHHFWDPHRAVDDLPPHHYAYRVRWPCEQFVLRVRLGSGGWPAPGLSLEVRDAAGAPAVWEEQAGHIMTGENRQQSPGAVPESVVAVYRPRLGYAYGVRWEVPDAPPLRPEDRNALRHTCRELHDPPPHLRGAARAAAQEFLQRVLKAADGIQSAPALDARAHLFAFDEENHRLRSVAAFPAGGSSFDSVAWGRDIIGSAFHRHVPVSFLRSPEAKEDLTEAGLAPRHLLRDLPQATQGVYACPLNGLAPPDWPIAILALISTEGTTGLRVLLRRDNTSALEKLTRQISALWTEYLERILGKDKSPPPRPQDDKIPRGKPRS